MTTSPWFPTVRPNPIARVFCAPFAGGGVAAYAPWQAAMPEGVEVLPLQLPGRERRLAERPLTSMRALLEQVVPAWLPLLDVPFVLFGHSMGGSIAYELALAAQRLGHAPAHLVVSARRAPGTPPTHPPLFALPQDQLVVQTEHLYGPMPAVLREQPALLAAFLPTLRADMQLLDTWIPPAPGELTIPVTAIGGADDRAVPVDRLAGWADVTTGPFHQRVVPGNHFSFLREASTARDVVVEIVRDVLRGA